MNGENSHDRCVSPETCCDSCLKEFFDGAAQPEPTDAELEVMMTAIGPPDNLTRRSGHPGTANGKGVVQ